MLLDEGLQGLHLLGPHLHHEQQHTFALDLVQTQGFEVLSDEREQFGQPGDHPLEATLEQPQIVVDELEVDLAGVVAGLDAREEL